MICMETRNAKGGKGAKDMDPKDKGAEDLTALNR